VTSYRKPFPLPDDRNQPFRDGASHERHGASEACRIPKPLNLDSTTW
jgi:hypothetical protein